MSGFKNKKSFRILALVLALITAALTLSACGKKEEPEPSTTEPSTEVSTTAAPTTTEAPAIRNPLTGEPGYDEALLKNRPVIISVENHPKARPQWGLCSSDVVMEMVAEGGITRMLLMYADKSRIPEKVGPVRSARHYFIELCTGFDAIFVHWGGSTYAYDEFAKGNCAHIDGMAISSCFFRDKSRNVDLEHTGYTKGSAIIDTISSKGMRTEIRDDYKNPFKFNTAAKTPSDGSCTSCTVSFSKSYTYTFSYDADTARYYSSLNGTAFKDSNGNQQNFTNVIVIYDRITDLGDSKSRVTFDLDNGHGVYLSNGGYRNITWEKGDGSQMLKFYDADGDRLSLNPGRTYIAIVGTNRESQTVIS